MYQVMSFGGLTNVGYFGSSALMNQKLNHALTGSEIAALTTTQKKKGMQILCTLTESGFTANHLYAIAADDTTILDMGLIDHAHTGTNDGGFIFHIDRENAGIYWNYLNLAPTADIFYTTTGTANGGTVVSTNEANGVEVSTNTTSGGCATATLSGVSMNFGAPMGFKIKLRATSSTNFTQCRIGINSEHANESNTTTRKALFEGCSSSGVNWLIASSDNTTRSTVSTSTAVAQGGRDSYNLDNILTQIIATFGASTVMAVKTSNLPVTGATSNMPFRAGLKNTAAENKQLYIGGIHIQGVVSDVDWVPVTSPF